MRSRVRTLGGYTLTEMLVVLVIVGLLASIIGPRLFSRLDDAKTRTARLQMMSLQTSIDLFRIDTGRLPTDEEGLGALIDAPEGEVDWLGPYLSRGLPLDPWGRDYVYALSDDGYRILSLGGDGREGGAGGNADIMVEAASASVPQPQSGEADMPAEPAPAAP